MAKKVLSVFGTRPEAIKMAPVVLGLQNHPNFDSLICVTAQHREMLDQVLNIFSLKPDYDLNLMKPNQDLFDVTSNVLLSMRGVIRDVDPDLVLVHGDTTTSFATALAAFYEDVDVGHVEAGLRTGDMSAPYPEEANRVLTGKIAKFHFAPTEKAKDNLLRENIDSNKVIVTGNTVIDALLMVRDKIVNYPETYWAEKINNILLERILDNSRKLILITGHRRENFGVGFINLCTAIKNLAESHSNWDFLYPVHLNPNVEKPVKEILGEISNVYLITPTDYETFVWLMERSDLILTDSGGIQEEGPTLGKPVLVMRDVTERPEAVEAGTVKLVGTEVDKIYYSVESVLGDDSIYKAMTRADNPYGDGNAVSQILDYLILQ